ncbi:MAG: hypothetical protein HY376_03585 [Candidatus Blackburnbacteria bacterium]|nr:hypothetical protein [Candidatus Blackburnbacteria bacterium]
MPLTFTIIDRGVAGNNRYTVADVAFDASYPNSGVRATSGEPLVPNDLGLSSFRLVMPEQRAGYTFDFDYVNNRLHAYRIAGTAALAHANSGVSAHVVVQPDAHATQAHDVTTVAAAGGGGALTEPVAAGPFESSAGGQVNPNVTALTAATLAHANFSVNAHTFTQADNHGARAEAALAEVTDTTDLSTALAQVRVVAFGY